MSPTPTNFPHPTPDVGLVREAPYKLYDGLLATCFCACLMIGLPGNCLALTHFLRSKKRNLSTLLYIVATSIDIISSVIHLPVAISLFRSRQPVIMESDVFCSIWYFILLSIQLMSMYVVALLSVSRAIVIFAPFYRVNKKVVLITIPVYFVYQAIWICLSYITSDNYYTLSAGLCQRVFSDKDRRMVNRVMNGYHVNYCISTGIPPICVFVSFVASVFKLRTGANESSIGSDGENVSNRNNRNASLAIMYFAATFLLCNSFTFVNTALFTWVYVVKDDYPGPIYSHIFMFFYSWPISEVFCTVLNAALNPLLYFWRMREFRSRVLQLLPSRE